MSTIRMSIKCQLMHDKSHETLPSFPMFSLIVRYSTVTVLAFCLTLTVQRKLPYGGFILSDLRAREKKLNPHLTLVIRKNGQRILWGGYFDFNIPELQECECRLSKLFPTFNQQERK